MKHNLLTDADIQLILSKNLYWDEVSKRDNPDNILHHETHEIACELGPKILCVLAEYAKSEKDRKTQAG